MKVLITGATGLVGNQLVKELLKKNYTVNYLTTSTSKIENKENYKGFYWNPAKDEIDLKSFDGVDVIINLAGASIAQRWTPTNKRKILNSRIDSLKTLKKGLVQSNVKSVRQLISASAIGIYPNSLDTYYEESCTKVDDSFLGEVTKAWEDAADEFNTLNLSVAKIRIGLVLSLNGGALPKLKQPIENYVGAPLGGGEQWQSWIHIKDLAKIFVFVLSHQLSGVYNGVAPNPVTNRKLTKSVASFVNKPIILPKVPAFMLKLFLGKMSYILLASQRVCSKKIEEEGFIFKYTNICGALEHLFMQTQKRKEKNFNKQELA
ncbi:NAD-dependent epimerase [Croceivirga lutea]|uniref:TIGR01777 family oxidoreductase n=1 Tax=Croceivirga lutea TaxID=1775167 RepID=UPI001639F72C|nr:TIGR01777 family oxidoreductase [Croceivirga lutea]GGG50064.1 NAD-dependent epimerase [Croceivirga lutea]